MTVLWRKIKQVGRTAAGVSACERTGEGELFRVTREGLTNEGTQSRDLRWVRE